jgi:hypothetical protein
MPQQKNSTVKPHIRISDFLGEKMFKLKLMKYLDQGTVCPSITVCVCAFGKTYLGTAIENSKHSKYAGRIGAMCE